VTLDGVDQFRQCGLFHRDLDNRRTGFLDVGDGGANCSLHGILAAAEADLDDVARGPDRSVMAARVEEPLDAPIANRISRHTEQCRCFLNRDVALASGHDRPVFWRPASASRRAAATWAGISETGIGVSESRRHVGRDLRDRHRRLGKPPPRGPVSPRPASASRRAAATWAGISETDIGVSESRRHVGRDLRDRRRRLGETPPRGPGSPRPASASRRGAATWAGISETGIGVSESRRHVGRDLRDRRPRLGETRLRGPGSPRPASASRRDAAT
jgi:hypothetical protein